ncbi:zinc D-Ala-D-Ala carboxypeptidase [Streptacidiphilus sp. BW17]|uniref:peptidoglycan-binding domain-containing protein n=1 Tax=Streptacidiphilus sp. BW17 TaxID=3156274 RepID=UPI0035112AF4
MRSRLTAMCLVAVAVLATGVATAPSASAQSVGNCTYTNSEPNLSEGATGIAVKQLQCELNYSLNPATGHPDLAVDGSFGPATLARVEEFQSCDDFSVDGQVGPVTWAGLDYWSASTGWLC